MEMHGKTLSEIDESLEAKPEGPLYFWQLYSLMGSKRIQRIIHAFYVRVYADVEAPWFRAAFTRISSLEHHVLTQTQFWVDAFGGGQRYHGGEGRLGFHHGHNAREVMNAQGAKRWMHHMTLTLNEDVDWSQEDPRVKPCIVDFLETRMRKYAAVHHWKYDASDFERLKAESTDPTPKGRSTDSTPSNVGSSSPVSEASTSSVDPRRVAQMGCHCVVQ